MNKKEIVTAVKFTSYVTSMIAVGCLGGHFAPKNNKLLRAAYALGFAFLETPLVLSASEYWEKMSAQLAEKYITSEGTKENEEGQ